jgi:hypothetical protein
VKAALAIVCCVFLVLGQALALSVPAAGTSVAQHDCGCGGKMSCCRQASVPQPVTATAPAGSQNQILSPVPAAVVWFLTAAEAAPISPTVSPSMSVGAAPIFARNCAWLI